MDFAYLAQSKIYYCSSTWRALALSTANWNPGNTETVIEIAPNLDHVLNCSAMIAWVQSCSTRCTEATLRAH